MTKNIKGRKDKYMVRMKILNIYNTQDVPDHVIEELKIVVQKIYVALAPIAEETNTNLMISATNHFMAMLVKMYISEKPEEIKKAALTLAKGFLGNVKFYTGVDPMEGED